MLATVAERFWSKVDRAGGPEWLEACWLWLPPTSQVFGYGDMHANGRKQYAHRLAWELASGRQIPAGLCVLHKCDNPRCVRPSHLFLGTKADNAHDAMAKGRAHPPPPSTTRAACPQGHTYAGHNLVTKADGTRRCRTCHNASERARRCRSQQN